MSEEEVRKFCAELGIDDFQKTIHRSFYEDSWEEKVTDWDKVGKLVETIQQLRDKVAGYERDMNEINELAADDTTSEKLRLLVIWYKSVYSPDEPPQLEEAKKTIQKLMDENDSLKRWIEDALDALEQTLQGQGNE